jgi:hypothetical protein
MENINFIYSMPATTGALNDMYPGVTTFNSLYVKIFLCGNSGIFH